jgi:hypothetical protein
LQAAAIAAAETLSEIHLVTPIRQRKRERERERERERRELEKMICEEIDKGVVGQRRRRLQ